MNIEFTSVKDLLIAIKSNLVAEKAKFNELQKAIDNDLMDCERALKALEKQEPEPIKTTERVPKVGDVLVCIKELDCIQINEEYVVSLSDLDFVDVETKDGKTFCFFPSSIQRYFRFQDEEPTPVKKTDRLPKNGDKLISIADKHFGKDEEVEVIHVDDVCFDVIRENSTICTDLYISSLHKIFRFKDEYPTPETPIHEARQQAGEKIDLAKSVNVSSPEDLTNLHSFQHVNPEAKKKPYRIKTREEMIRDGADQCLNESIYLFHSNFSFTNMMGYLHGRELDTNEKQRIKAEPHHSVDEWIIDTWMITENN